MFYPRFIDRTLQKELIQSFSGHGIFLVGLFLFMIVTSQTTYHHDNFVTVQLKSLGGMKGASGGQTGSLNPKAIPSPVKPLAKPLPATTPKKETPPPKTEKVLPKTPAPSKTQNVKPSVTTVPKKISPSQNKMPSLSERLKNRLTEVKSAPNNAKFVEPQKWAPATQPTSDQRFVEPEEWTSTQKAGPGTSAQTQLSVGGGGAGDGQGGSSDGKEFPFAWYLDLVQNKITMNWKEPAKPLIKDGNLFAIVSFVIRKDGSVKEVTLTERSTFDVLNQSVMDAVQASIPLPPLPQNFQDDELTIKIKFELTQ